MTDADLDCFDLILLACYWGLLVEAMDSGMRHAEAHKRAIKKLMDVVPLLRDLPDCEVMRRADMALIELMEAGYEFPAEVN